MEFVKVIFLKLWSDRQVIASPAARRLANGSLSVPASEVYFSRQWIESREQETANPLDAILFKGRIEAFELEIANNSKRRIFAPSERINLSAETLKAITGRLEHIDLHSIDEDLNGRMFETFLNSTLRGKDLGQYFTPRSIVKLATGIADLHADQHRVDRVIDACCGTGGFLIEALSVLQQKIDQNASLSNIEKEQLKRKVANESLIGVDIARDPALARIARINMYLHGDGGSKIFQLDALDKSVRRQETDDVELVQEKAAFKQLVSNSLNEHTGGPRAGVADVALTNPPFAKEYNRKQMSDNELLDSYELAFNSEGGGRAPIQAVSSMHLFFERYYELLAPRGRLISVVDDGILGGPSHSRLRSWLRSHFIIEAVISLPGDAFQRSQARVKTSLLVLRKKSEESEEQPDVFMYYCSSVGVDDSPRQRVLPIDAVNRENADAEVASVIDLFRKFKTGALANRDWVVPASAISERMDVKAVMPQLRHREIGWTAAGLPGIRLGDYVENVLALADAAARPVNFDEAGTDEVTYLRVSYDGFCEAAETVSIGDLPRGRYTWVRAGDIAISHINAIHGAVGIVPEHLDGTIVTSEYTLIRSSSDIHTYVLWAMLRSSEARADMLLRSTGIGRTRVNWSTLSEMLLPRPPEAVAHEIIASLSLADEAEAQAARQRRSALDAVSQGLFLETPLSETIISAFKPPR
nr:N-6 DNA methylase [Quadrisphaera sp. RL12-1S]